MTTANKWATIPVGGEQDSGGERTIALGHSVVGFGVIISDHIKATGHEVYYRFWDARCCDCGWRADLFFKGEPFNPLVLCDWFATVRRPNEARRG